MPQPPESSSTTTTSQQQPLHHLLQSCLLNTTTNKESAAVSQCLNDESPIHCFWNVFQSRIISSNASLMMPSSSTSAGVFTPTRAELRNAHDNLRKDWNLSSLIWN